MIYIFTDNYGNYFRFSFCTTYLRIFHYVIQENDLHPLKLCTYESELFFDINLLFTKDRRVSNVNVAIATYNIGNFLLPVYNFNTYSYSPPDISGAQFHKSWLGKPPLWWRRLMRTSHLRSSSLFSQLMTTALIAHNTLSAAPSLISSWTFPSRCRLSGESTPAHPPMTSSKGAGPRYWPHPRVPDSVASFQNLPEEILWNFLPRKATMSFLA